MYRKLFRVQSVAVGGLSLVNDEQRRNHVLNKKTWKIVLPSCQSCFSNLFPDVCVHVSVIGSMSDYGLIDTLGFWKKRKLKKSYFLFQNNKMLEKCFQK